MSERAALVERIGKEAVARYSYIHPSAITMGADTGVDGETWGDIVRDIGNLALAAVEAAGGWPRVEPVTEGDIHQALGRVQSTPSIDWLRDYITREILATLRSRGITVEGAK